MNGPDAALQTIEVERLIAIIRLASLRQCRLATEAVLAGGIRIIEFSMASPVALEAVRSCRREYGGNLLVGAGTVLTVEDARNAVEAGASFLIAPDTNGEVVRWAAEHGVLHIPGALTPTEIMSAVRAGVPLVKLFPAGRLGPEYVRDLRGPLPNIRLIPTGGVDATNAEAFLKAGAVAVAVGSSLVSASAVASPETIVTRAREMVRAIG